MKLIDKLLGRCLWEQARISGQRPAMEMGDWSCTFKELDRVSDLLAGRMKRYNIEKGTHVGIWSVSPQQHNLRFVCSNGLIDRLGIGVRSILSQLRGIRVIYLV